MSAEQDRSRQAEDRQDETEDRIPKASGIPGWSRRNMQILRRCFCLLDSLFGFLRRYVYTDDTQYFDRLILFPYSPVFGDFLITSDRLFAGFHKSASLEIIDPKGFVSRILKTCKEI